MAVSTIQNASLASGVPSSVSRSALPAGSVLQVVSATKTDTFSSSSTSYVDITGLSVSITPISSSSKILVFGQMLFGRDNGDDQVLFQIVRQSTSIYLGKGSVYAGEVRFGYSNLSMITLDSPSTTSATTYKLQGRISGGSGSWWVNTRGFNPSSGDGYSSITVMEVAG
jgi:hypothetical protein